jgi:hypothetical protein
MEQLTCILCFFQDPKASFALLNATSLFHSHKSFGADHYETSDHKPSSIPTNGPCDDESDPFIHPSVRPSVRPSIHLSLYSPCEPWPLFQFLNLYTVGRTPWTSDQPVIRPLPTHSTTQTQTSMPRVGFEPTMTVFERAKTVPCSDHAATVIDSDLCYATQFNDAANGSVHS